MGEENIGALNLSLKKDLENNSSQTSAEADAPTLPGFIAPIPQSQRQSYRCLRYHPRARSPNPR
jgi:hypothetical protein